MIRMGVIQQSNSDFTSPIVIVRKKDNSNRFCIDFRKLNAIAVKDSYLMPLIEERLESLRGKDIFRCLDLTSGYWQFAVETSSRKITAFISHSLVRNKSADCEKVFRKLINRLLNPPVLRFPDFKKRFRLSTDASNVGVGAVLFQTDENGNEHVIALTAQREW